MSKVAIMTDTISLTSQEVADQFSIKLMPMSVIIEGKAYSETEIDLAWFYEQISKWKEAGNMPKSSSIGVGAFLQVYRELSQRVKAILYIGHSSKFGMSSNAATQAKKMAEEELPQTAIEVIDSFTVAAGQMLIAIEAARAAAGGNNLPEIVELTKSLVKRVNCVLILDDLSLLAKGGRIHKARPWADSQITNTALLEASSSTGGEMKPLARSRTRHQALEKLFEIVKERSGSGKLHVAINHADAHDEAEELKKLTLSRLPCAEVFITPAYPVVTANTGVGAFHFGWWSEG